MAEQEQEQGHRTCADRVGRVRSDISAVLLTSTRAVPGAILDAYSDYDVIVVVDQVELFDRDPRWLSQFGEVLIAYWDPVEVDPVSGAVSVSNITQYVNGLKIDFGRWSTQRLSDLLSATSPLDELDAGYRVLVDKRGLTSDLPSPTSLQDRYEDPSRALRGAGC
jgi:aminoglycoside 6-adenylyltransferase